MKQGSEIKWREYGAESWHRGLVDFVSREGNVLMMIVIREQGELRAIPLRRATTGHWTTLSLPAIEYELQPVAS